MSTSNAVAIAISCLSLGISIATIVNIFNNRDH